MSADKIDLEAKSDRELLILSVQRLNDLCDMDARVRTLEDWRNYLAGGFALLTFVILLFGSWLLGKV